MQQIDKISEQFLKLNSDEVRLEEYVSSRVQTSNDPH